MARQSPNRPEADEPTVEPETEAAGSAAEPEAAGTAAESESEAASSAAAEPAKPAAEPAAGGGSVWDDARIAPVEIAMPGGVGLTLRAYRLASELTPTEVDLSADEDPFDARERLAGERRTSEDDEEVVILDEEFAALVAEDDVEAEGEKAAAADEAAADDTEIEEEVPLFLSHKGRLLTFKTPESLLSFIRSGAPHDMTQLDTWQTFAERVELTDLAPAPEDTFELDLVVENLRGGHDTWDLELLIGAGEIARDLGHALHLKPVILALAPGSPLDDLDESLRSASNGGMSGFFGRRRLRKIGAQQASLGWRSIIGKISAAVDWRD
ncbi:MAG TPA: DNA primase [Actinoplanes sp.]|nr:DNA primase [Actinoplanes sp.]